MSTRYWQPWLQVSDRIATALEEGRPVVALESTVIAHGLPYPDNVSAALRIEQAVIEGGAIPATICINNGKFIIGMSEQEIERFASQRGIPKVSSRDVGIILAQKGLGATTVASTLIAAHGAGIPFFSTAGIGGVHRGASATFDISADLLQFTRSRVAVVCAGAKSILDIGLTLEYLETLGVPIIGYRSQDFPAFYSVSSGYHCPHSSNDEREIATIISTHWSIGNDSTVLITHPIHAEDAIDHSEVEKVIQSALHQAEQDEVTGPAITPYLMKKVSQATEGRSARANMAVLISTARVAGELAHAYTDFIQDRTIEERVSI